VKEVLTISHSKSADPNGIKQYPSSSPKALALEQENSQTLLTTP